MVVDLQEVVFFQFSEILELHLSPSQTAPDDDEDDESDVESMLTIL